MFSTLSCNHHIWCEGVQKRHRRQPVSLTFLYVRPSSSPQSRDTSTLVTAVIADFTYFFHTRSVLRTCRTPPPSLVSAPIIAIHEVFIMSSALSHPLPLMRPSKMAQYLAGLILVTVLILTPPRLQAEPEPAAEETSPTGKVSFFGQNKFLGWKGCWERLVSTYSFQWTLKNTKDLSKLENKEIADLLCRKSLFFSYLLTHSLKVLTILNQIKFHKWEFFKIPSIFVCLIPNDIPRFNFVKNDKYATFWNLI